MLQIGKRYWYEHKGNHKFEVTNFLGSGIVADVYEARSLDSYEVPEVFVIKVPRSPEYYEKIVSEALILEKIKDYFINHNLKLSVPNVFGMLKIQSEGQEFATDALFMEYISAKSAQELFTLYQNKISDNPGHAFQVEILAWKAALQFLHVIRASVLQAHIYNIDIKRDSFRWHESDQRLIVMDWNQTNVVQDRIAAENRMLVALSQSWYTMMTRRQATSPLPSKYDIGAWNRVSIHSRKLLNHIFSLSQLGKTQVSYVDNVEKEIGDTILLLEMSAPSDNFNSRELLASQIIEELSH